MIDLKTAPYAAFVLRLTLGAAFVAHALLKLVVFTPAGTVGFFESLGLPGALAAPTIAVELLGGIALLLGYRTRLVALVLAPVLLGAIVFAHAGNGWLFTSEGGGWEFPAMWLSALVSQGLLGDGAFAVRRVMLRRHRAALEPAAA